jgi:hypothetical protein
MKSFIKALSIGLPVFVNIKKLQFISTVKGNRCSTGSCDIYNKYIFFFIFTVPYHTHEHVVNLVVWTIGHLAHAKNIETRALFELYDTLFLGSSHKILKTKYNIAGNFKD